MGENKRFLALAGNIGTGKTTAAKIISQHMGYELFDEPVIDNRFLARYYSDMKRWSFTLQLEFLIRRVEHHELIATVPKSCVQDRTLYEDPEIFAKYLHGLGHMSQPELDLYFEYFERLTRDLHRPDLVVVLEGPASTNLLRRIRLRGRKEEQSIPEEFLTGLSGYYVSFPMVCKEKYGIPVVRFDVHGNDIRSESGRKLLLDLVDNALAGKSTDGKMPAPEQAIAS